MYKSAYLNNLWEETKKKYEHESEFLSAVEEFFDSVDFFIVKHPELEQQRILERIIVPERIIQMRISWLDDKNQIQVNTGYRVQFNSAIGPYKGGIRFHPSVNLSILKFLGFEQTFKNSLTTLPMGGGKGGADFDPKGKSDMEIMRFCQAYMSELFRHIGPDTDVPAGDIGVGAREVGYMFGYYKKLKNEWSGTLTGKGLSFGGSLIRPEATGYGLLYYVEELLKTMTNKTMKGQKVLVSGMGNVATYAMEKTNQMGGVVLACSNSKGYLVNPKGLDVPYLVKVLTTCKRDDILPTYLAHDKSAKFIEGSKGIWSIPCDIALPCATQREIDINNAKTLKANGCFLVAEGANMPTEVEAIRYFNTNGVIFVPGKASNAGGVAVSGLEMSQNAMHLSWTKEEVDARLKEIMINIFHACYNTAKEYGQENNLALGANISGFEKVYQAMLAQGVC